MTTPLSQEQRVELVAKAKAATPGPWVHKTGAIGGGCHIQTEPGGHVAAVSDWGGKPANAAFIAAANPSTILAFEATVQALTVERDEALERVKVLEAGLADASLGLQAIAEFWNRHADYMDVMSALHRMIDRATTTRESLALLTPKDPGQ